ncbi:hypothetical protein C7B69_01750 [filamentous cyanobacterium Phorm 46]|nr:hypothetical protein C7B69_01750 [filamentous cyanobacterium Phorm 46]
MSLCQQKVKNIGQPTEFLPILDQYAGLEIRTVFLIPIPEMAIKILIFIAISGRSGLAPIFFDSKLFCI